MTDVASDTQHPEPRKKVDELFSYAYDELKRLASAVRRKDMFSTLTTTALVNEAWLKLSGPGELSFADEAHFRHIVVRAMRQVLVDSARRRRAIKRGGFTITLDDSIGAELEPEDRVLAIDAALERLTALSERQARVVEVRFFGGFDVAETARILGISTATVQRDWRIARAWLQAELIDAHDGASRASESRAGESRV